MLYSGLDKPERPRAVLSRKQLKLTYKSVTFAHAGEAVSRPCLEPRHHVLTRPPPPAETGAFPMGVR